MEFLDLILGIFDQLIAVITEFLQTLFGGLGLGGE